ncbi:hypothetical protein GCM10020331_012040 [Ectobacillus funiculus]
MYLEVYKKMPSGSFRRKALLIHIIRVLGSCLVDVILLDMFNLCEKQGVPPCFFICLKKPDL